MDAYSSMARITSTLQATEASPARRDPSASPAHPLPLAACQPSSSSRNTSLSSSSILSRARCISPSSLGTLSSDFDASSRNLCVRDFKALLSLSPLASNTRLPRAEFSTTGMLSFDVGYYGLGFEIFGRLAAYYLK